MDDLIYGSLLSVLLEEMDSMHTIRFQSVSLLHSESGIKWNIYSLFVICDLQWF